MRKVKKNKKKEKWKSSTDLSCIITGGELLILTNKYKYREGFPLYLVDKTTESTVTTEV